MTHTEVPQGSDLEQLVKLLARAGYSQFDAIDPDPVPLSIAASCKTYAISHNPDGDTHRIGYRSGPSFVAYWDLTLPQGIGYTGFLCEFYFDQAGALLHHGVWE